MTTVSLPVFIFLVAASTFFIFLISPPEGHPVQGDPLSGETIYQDVNYYSNLGHHRTATGVDLDTSQWLQDRLKKAGYSTRIQEWTTKQFFPKETYIEMKGHKKIKAFPVWWPKPTEEKGIRALLSSSLATVGGKIFFFKNITGPGFSVDENLIHQVRAAAEQGAKAVVLASISDRGDMPSSNEFIGLNANQTTQEEWPIPVIMAGIKDFADLETALMNHEEVRVVSTGTYNQAAPARNIIGSLVRSPANETFVISTPSSGWFNCAGERGSGIGLWLALAEWVQKNTHKTNWIFVATSGHELKGLGTEHLLSSSLVPPPGKVRLWIHIGAWQAMYNYTQKKGYLVRTMEMSNKIIQYAGEDLAKAVSKGFGDPGLKVRIVPRIVFGDLTQVVQYDYENLAGISYGHPYHHSNQDLPEVTGPELLEPMARAYLKFLQVLGID